VRAPARKPRWLNPAPCTAAKGIYLVGARKQELPGATLLGNAVDVTWKRNGGEHAWSILRISRVFDISSTKRRCPGCIGCEQTAAKRDGRPKNASTGTGLSDVDISHDQSSRWQKFAAVPEEIFEHEVQSKTHSCRRLVNSDQSELLPDCAEKVLSQRRLEFHGRAKSKCTSSGRRREHAVPSDGLVECFGLA
jgi:hypothetical protein